MRYSAKYHAIVKISLFWIVYCFLRDRSLLYVTRGTRIYKDGSARLSVRRLFIDIKHGGQFFFPSNILLKRKSELFAGLNVNIFSGANIHLFEGARVFIGSDTYFSGPFVLHSKKQISIGDRCSISWGVTILDSNFHETDGKVYTEEVSIGDDVWIGTNATILPGVKLESGCIVAAGSLLIKGYYRKGLWAGVPAKFKKLI